MVLWLHWRFLLVSSLLSSSLGLDIPQSVLGDPENTSSNSQLLSLDNNVSFGCEVNEMVIEAPTGGENVGFIDFMKQALLNCKVLVFKNAAMLNETEMKVILENLSFSSVKMRNSNSVGDNEENAAEKVFEEPVPVAPYPYLDSFHASYSWKERPAGVSALQVVNCDGSCGLIAFADAETAYERLPKDLKNQLRKRKAIHCLNPINVPRTASTTASAATSAVKRTDSTILSSSVATSSLHPSLPSHCASHSVFITSATSGRKSIYVNPAYTQSVVGWSETQSKALLSYVFSHVAHFPLLLRHNLTVGEWIIWDSTAVQVRLSASNGEPARPKFQQLHLFLNQVPSFEGAKG